MGPNAFLASVFSATIAISPLCAQPTPYLGAPSTIPGIIPPQNFDEGGSGVAYYINGEWSRNGNYPEFRPTETVSLENNSGSIQVGWFHSGSWIKYSYEVATPGEYDVYFTYRCGSFDTPRTITLDFGRTEPLPVEFQYKFNDNNWSSLPKGERALVAHGLALDSGPGVLTVQNTGGSDINLLGVEFELKAVGVRRDQVRGSGRVEARRGDVRTSRTLFSLPGGGKQAGSVDASGRRIIANPLK